MNEIPLGVLFLLTSALWVVLVALGSAEFSLFHIARSRLRQLAAAGNRSAQLADTLLRSPDRLRISVRIAEILLLIGIAAGSTLLMVRTPGGFALPFGLLLIAAGLVFSTQWLPRRLRSEHEWWVVVSARLLGALVTALLPVTAAMGAHSKAPRGQQQRGRIAAASAEQEQRALHERVADLDNITVDDIMIPRNDLAVIDVANDWDDTLNTLRSTPHTRLPLCEDGIDNIVGIVHMKKVAHALARDELTRERLLDIARAREPYFTPEGTTLSDQLVNFKRDRRRVALVVDEYGDIQGLVTLEDILEEVVGEFTTGPALLTRDVHRESEGSFVVSGGASVRELNRALGWSLPVDGPRTLNGLIVEQLETIPQPGTTFRVGDLAIEILQTAENAVRSARVRAVSASEAIPELSKGAA